VTDPFLDYVAKNRKGLLNDPDIREKLSKPHHERAHSKFSASGADHWMACPGSVALSEGVPDKSSPWAEEGTQAHEVLEAVMKFRLRGDPIPDFRNPKFTPAQYRDMRRHANETADFVLNEAKKLGVDPQKQIMVESRVTLEQIHYEMFGTLDLSLLEYFGELHIFDFKYGQGHTVSPVSNKQMIFYALAIAHKYDWNFTKARLWIIQPRSKGYNGPVYWDMSMKQLELYEKVFRAAVESVEKYPDTYEEGEHCHWCKAKSICPLKTGKKLENAKKIFDSVSGPVENF